MMHFLGRQYFIAVVTIMSCQQSQILQPQKISFLEVSETHLPEIVKLPNNSMDAKVVDIDGDGDLDIVVAVEFYKNAILLNDGKGRFKDQSSLLPDKVVDISAAPYRYYPYHDSEDVATEDFDKDGMIDIIFVTEDDEKNEYYKQRSDGTFEDISDVLPGTGVSNAVAAGDVDGDGWIDLIVGNNGQNFLWRNVQGVFLNETMERLPKLDDITQDVEFADVDKDGDLDILVSNEKENRILENDGKGYFSIYPKGSFFDIHSQETREGDIADVNDDGWMDLYFANVSFFQQVSPASKLWLSREGKFIEASENLQISYDGGSVDCDFVDIDSDGDVDLLCGNGTLQGTKQGFTVALNDGNGFFTDATDDFINQDIAALVVDVEVADFTGDGVVDVYLSCFRSSDRLLVGIGSK